MCHPMLVVDRNCCCDACWSLRTRPRTKSAINLKPKISLLNRLDAAKLSPAHSQPFSIQPCVASVPAGSADCQAATGYFPDNPSRIKKKRQGRLRGQVERDQWGTLHIENVTRIVFFDSDNVMWKDPKA